MEKIVQRFKVEKDGSFVSLKMTVDSSRPIMTEKQVCRVLTFDSNGAKSLHAPLSVNSLLGTFAPGQTNACGVRHVPYLPSLRHAMFFTGDSNDKNEIPVFRLRMWILFAFRTLNF